MFIRKIIPILIFLAGAILGKPIALASLGLFAKAYLYFQNGWVFSYGALNWFEGKLIFSDIVLKESSWKMAAPKAEVFWSIRHLEIDHPRVEIYSIPKLRQKGDDWTIQVWDGTLKAKHFQNIRFHFEKTWTHHLGRLHLENHDSRIEMEAALEENEIWLSAKLDHFDGTLLKPWIETRGFVDGRIHLVFHENQIKRGSAHLEFREGGYKDYLQDVAAALDWEGEIGNDVLAKTSRFRLNLSHANLQGALGGFTEMQGNCSFTSGVGAKWDFQGKGYSLDQQFPISSKGKAFLHESRPFWVEGNFQAEDSNIAVEGNKEEWKVLAHKIDAKVATFFQSLWGIGDSRLQDLAFEKGQFDCDGIWVYGKSWKLHFQGQDLHCKAYSVNADCPRAEISFSSEKNGMFQLEKLNVKRDKVTCTDWTGFGIIEKGSLVHSELKGCIDKMAIEVTALGSLDAFQIAAVGNDARVHCKGKMEDGIQFAIADGFFEGLGFEGRGQIQTDGQISLHIDHFQGSIGPLQHLLHERISGEIESIGNGFQLDGNSGSFDWHLQAKGKLQDDIGFYLPFVEKKGERLFFDVRIDTPTWEIVRLYGSKEKDSCQFDPERCHLLGQKLQISSCTFDSLGLQSLQFNAPVSWDTFIMNAPIWIKDAKEWITLPCRGSVLFDFSFERDGLSKFSLIGKDLFWKQKEIPFQLAAFQDQNGWQIDNLLFCDCNLKMLMRKEKNGLVLTDGKVSCKDMLAHFSGYIDSQLHFEFQVPQFSVSFASVSSLIGYPLPEIVGTMDGKGVITRGQNWEADFDITTSAIHSLGLEWQNTTPLHLHYASDTGILCTGLDVKASGPDLPFLECKIDLLQCDLKKWNFKGSNLHLPPHFLKGFSAPAFLQKWDPEEDIYFTADISSPFDFSSLQMVVKEGLFPIHGMQKQIQDLTCSLDTSTFALNFFSDIQGYPVQAAVHIAMDGDLKGRLILQEPHEDTICPLTIDWSYSDKFMIHEIDGQFAGIDASFHHTQKDALIGSARIDFEKACKVIPQDVSAVLQDLKMGSGFEIKGELNTSPISFKGLFSGKQIDLFGFRFRTFLSQMEFDPTHLRLYDLKISDSAGVFKIDELIVQTEGDTPWAISIPHLSITEFRPTLLQKPGLESGPAGPLVVRELKMENFRGILDDSRTYTAKGALSFINSYRREHTVFDIPSDLLGRIVGLDLELLIPACGILQYELKNGFFHLVSLQNSFSEAGRSEFFLVDNPPAIMDLDGNLRILISMKQFVLFKLTESFQILIDGTLSDPKFHLQKNRRFLGL